MAEIRQIRDWHEFTATGALYEKLLGSLGTAGFGSTVRDGVLSMTRGVRRIYLFEATGPNDTALQYFCGEPGLADLFPVYRKCYLRLDPVFDAYRAAPRAHDLAYQRVRPADIRSPGFRRCFFEEPGIAERLSVIQRGVESWRVMNVSRHESEGRFTDEEIRSLLGLACLALPMLPLNRRHMTAAQPLSIAQLEQRFASRFDCLTPRERQVCARAAAGMSVEATANALGIARTSVLTYRQRAYQRLKVKSPVELRALITH
ncbi:MAG TPA: helix-turn-helix transcriptional regulator [Steroidobacteraceae bacterium]|nr:helix-turn-helix transcriptional regulator [Steroidobacteraceae bacterium]